MINSKKREEKNYSDILNSLDHFFCISHFNGDISWVKNIKKENYIIYNKSGNNIDQITSNYISIDNVGYNIYSYLKFIIDNYENLPSVIVFCKDNIFTRHISIELFLNLIKRKCFTSLENNLNRENYPININISDNGFVEINNSWYKFNFPRKYFSEYDEFYSYIFDDCNLPDYVRFSPGANFIVPKENILLRSKNFYKNLIKFINYTKLSCESHFLERSLITIFNSNVQSSDRMNNKINNKELILLEETCQLKISKEYKFIKKIKNLIIIKSLYLNYIILKLLK
tara:strand:- start:5 stop:859 length:855 start_codon:yes stop_codon:yes gene_type:complete